VAILGLPADPRLHRVVDERRGVVRLPPEGLAISEVLAVALGVTVGDVVTVEVLENERVPRARASSGPGGARPDAVTAKGTRPVPVTDLIADFAGTAAYMRLDALHRMMREGGSLSGAFLRVDAARLGDLYAGIKGTPQIGSVSVKRATLDSFRKTIAENLLIMRTFNVVFAAIIAFGVVYNAARISAAERSLELGTLRVMGFTHAEVSAILLGELAVLVLAAIPVGLVLGHYFAAFATAAMATETQRFPFFISRFTYGFAATVVLVSALISGSSVRRQLRRLDLVAVLKAKD
jgi:putative ABC transport system permease protein